MFKKRELRENMYSAKISTFTVSNQEAMGTGRPRVPGDDKIIKIKQKKTAGCLGEILFFSLCRHLPGTA